MVVACTYLSARSSRKSNRRLQTTRAIVLSIAWNKYFSTDFEKEFFLEKPAAFDARVYATIPFSPFANTDGFYGNRRSDWIAKETSLPSWHRVLCAPTTRAFTHTLAIAIGEFLLVTDPMFDNKIGPRRAPTSLCLSPSSCRLLEPFGIQSVWYVFPMNNIGGVSKSCRLHDCDSNENIADC